ncbi:hypothetical protein GW916_07850 [bacterium]|nr:hypothetical protein [bacterium]
MLGRYQTSVSHRNYFLLLILILFFGSSQTGFSKGKNRKVAQISDEGVHEVVLSYEKDANSFRNLKLHLTVSNPFLTFESFENQEYVLDCPNPNNDRDWTCFSACEGGSLKILFSKSTGFQNIEIPPFEITPRLCDGSESDDDQKLTSRKTLKFSLKDISPKIESSSALKNKR